MRSKDQLFPACRFSVCALRYIETGKNYDEIGPCVAAASRHQERRLTENHASLDGRRCR